MTKPLVHIGWVLLSDGSDEDLTVICRRAAGRTEDYLEQQFPAFQWKMSWVRRRRYPPYGALDPLELLEAGVQDKIRYRWDYALVLVHNELDARYRASAIGVPSSAFEVAVMSTTGFSTGAGLEDRLAALALHLLGHLWGLDHADSGPMVPPAYPDDLQLSPFPDDQREAIQRRLAEASDDRVEEQGRRRGKLRFYLDALRADPRGVWHDIWGYQPWKLPLKMGRMTAATVVTILFSLLGSETWDIGIHVGPWTLVLGTVLSVLGAAVFIFAGQNLGRISRSGGLREQLIRTRVVGFVTLLLGMSFLWLTIFLMILASCLALPRSVICRWLNLDVLHWSQLAGFAAFMAILGMLAGAMGGNLEEGNEIKADLFYDEET